MSIKYTTELNSINYFIAWHYNDAGAAEFTANEYFNNYINK